MKSKIPVLFFARDSLEAKFISKALYDKGIIDHLVVESGIVAKRAKLRRYFKNISIFGYPKVFIDIIAILLFNISVSTKLSRKYGKLEYPKVETSYIDDINEKRSIAIVRKYGNPIIVVLGTGIIKDSFMKQKHKVILNIHGGIVPYYRNVYSEFWALKNTDTNNIGTTIIKLDSGIDTGDIVLQERIKYKKGDSYLNVKLKNLELSSELISSAVEKYKTGKVKPRKQKTIQETGYHKTPKAIDLFRFLISGRL